MINFMLCIFNYKKKKKVLPDSIFYTKPDFVLVKDCLFWDNIPTWPFSNAKQILE